MHSYKGHNSWHLFIRTWSKTTSSTRTTTYDPANMRTSTKRTSVMRNSAIWDQYKNFISESQNSNNLTFELRPCVRRKFPNFSFSRVSEMFGFRNSEIFRKKTEFPNFGNFRKKVQKKVRKLLENVCKYRKFRKKYVKFEFLSQKTLFLGQKVRK